MSVLPYAGEKRMMLSPSDWPMWPWLPIKRRDNSLENENLGVLMADFVYDEARKGNGKFVVYHVYVFQTPKSKAEWDASPKTEYDTIDELLADGWIVD